MEIITKSARETKEFGKRFAHSLIKAKSLFFCAILIGELGSGKTTFVQGFSSGLGIKRRIISPSFILMRSYNIPKKIKNFNFFYHVDLYRIDNLSRDEVENLGLLDIFKKDKSVILIEWGEKIKEFLPKGSYLIEFKYLQGNQRKIEIRKLPSS